MEIPKNFVPYEIWPEYDWLANPPSICAREQVPGSLCGIRWSLWPFTFEEHVGDEEPDLKTGGKLARPRLVSWKRMHSGPVPKGWSAGRHPWRVDAYHALGPDYADTWHASARRHRKDWKSKHLDKTHAIEPVSWQEYAAAYKKSTVARNIGNEQLMALGRRHALGGPELFGVRDLATGEIIAGTAIHHSPTRKSSMREAPFMLPQARDCHAMTGLVDFWFDLSLKRGADFLTFSHFSHPGAAKSWGGFSAFKRQFGVTEVSYPPVLWRFVLGKPF
jgi:hypothetical protein